MKLPGKQSKTTKATAKYQTEAHRPTISSPPFPPSFSLSSLYYIRSTIGSLLAHTIILHFFLFLCFSLILLDLSL
ncbi:hypothetical protein QQP08_023252 [Theobroma cacao]|nr:hypothetical protein QQP08_023252 [Theobroma cacao]